MRKTRRIIPFVFCGLLISCTTERRLARVRISQPQMKETVADTGKQLPGQIAWTDDKGEEHLVKQVSHDSVTGENMTLIELSEVTVMAKSKQVAERNGKINLDFLVTVPGELINNKWQVQLTPVAYKPSDTLYLDKIFLSGADFAKMQEKGYMRAAVRNNPMNIRYIENPTEKVQLSVLHADREAAALISSPSEAVRKQAEEMYGLKLEKPADREAEPSSEAPESSATRRTPRKKTEQSTQSTRKPSARQVKTAIEKLDKDLREIQEIPQVKNRDEKLIKALEEFNSSAVPEKKGCDVESILKDLRGKGVKVEAMKAEEWHSLMNGKAIRPSLISGASKPAAKGAPFMLTKTPVGYAVKAVNTVNSLTRQASADM
ncbi:hypothetical protein [Bacteroides hominis]